MVNLITFLTSGMPITNAAKISQSKFKEVIL